MEALLLTAVWSLFRHNTNPFVPQHPDAEHCDPTSVDEPHGLDCQHCGDDVISVVLPPRHGHQPVPCATDKDKSARPEEPKEAGPDEFRLARQWFALLGLWSHLERSHGEARQAPVAGSCGRGRDSDLAHLVSLANDGTALALDYHYECTRQHLSAILEGEGGEGVLLVDPNHSVAKSAHAENTSPCGTAALPAWPTNGHRQTLSGGSTRTHSIRSQPLRLKNAKELVAGGKRPRIGTVGNEEQSQGGEVQVPMVFCGEQSPVEIARLADRDRGSVLGDHLHPGGRVHLHQGVRDEDHVHPVEDAGDHRVPESDVTFEVENTDHDLSLGVTTSGGDGASVCQHRSSRYRDSKNRAVLLGRVLDVGRCVVRQPWRWVPVLGRAGQVLRDEPEQLGPTLELHHLASCSLRKAFVTGLAGQGQVNTAGTEKKPDLLTSSVSPGERHLDGHRDGASHDAAVEGAHHVERVVVRVDQGYPVAGLHLHLARLVVQADLIEEGVGDFLAS